LGSSTAAHAQSQPARNDSGPHFALFTGTMGQSVGLSAASLGVSGDFHLGQIPVPLRFSASFGNQLGNAWRGSSRDANASLELVMRPISKRLGIQPYFLGGVGVATRSEYGTYTAGFYDGNGNYMGSTYALQPRQNWAFASFGAGLDIGRAFIQIRSAVPIAQFAPTIAPVSFGFRFWD
jgi:hypothetical protein